LQFLRVPDTRFPWLKEFATKDPEQIVLCGITTFNRVILKAKVARTAHACKDFAVGLSFATDKILSKVKLSWTIISNPGIRKARAALQEPLISERMNSVIGSKTVVMLTLLISVHK
jgi:hypothetical protein